jgi:hypothetical protein
MPVNFVPDRCTARSGLTATPPGPRGHAPGRGSSDDYGRNQTTSEETHGTDS